MDKYEIGTRLKGYSKNYLKALTCEISKKFNATDLEKKIVPHLTFLRPFKTENEPELIGLFEEILSQYKESINYSLEGFGAFKNKEKVFYGKIGSNPQIEDMINNLENSLEENINFIHPQVRLPEDKNKINLHCSIISSGVKEYYSEISDFLDKQNFKEIVNPLLRVYLLKNDFILREFDFYLNLNLERFDAINPFIYRETEKAFEDKTGHKITKEGIILSIS